MKICRLTNPRNVSKQIELRRNLECKPFKWYMENIASDILQHYPPVPIPPFAHGQIRSMAAELCIDTKHGNIQAKFGLDLCFKDQTDRTGEQVIANQFIFFVSELISHIFRILNSLGDKIFVRKVVIFVSMFRLVDVNLQSFSTNVMVLTFTNKSSHNDLIHF